MSLAVQRRSSADGMLAARVQLSFSRSRSEGLPTAHSTQSAGGGPEPEMPPHGRDHPRPLSVSLGVGVGDLKVHVRVARERGRVPGFGHLDARFRPGCRNERVIRLTDGGGHDL